MTTLKSLQTITVRIPIENTWGISYNFYQNLKENLIDCKVEIDKINSFLRTEVTMILT